MVRFGIQVALAGLLALPAAAGAKSLKTLYTFTQPFGSLGEFVVAKSGQLYGTSTKGGTAGLGTVFAFDPVSKVLTILYSFQGGSDGSTPVPGMVLENGVLYGVTSAGGAANDGTAFSFDTTAGTETVLHAFSGADGQAPAYAPILGADGALYGTTPVGGTGAYGVVYRLDQQSGVETVLLNFNGTNGANPNALTLGPSGVLYATTHGVYGAADLYGSIFTLDPSTDILTTLYSFSSYVPGSAPFYSVVLGKDGSIYGTGTGDAFKFVPATGAFSTLKAYDYSHLGPTGNLVMDKADKNIYGVDDSPNGGNFGQVFQYNIKTGVVTIIAGFSGGTQHNGSFPQGTVFGKNGDLYGTTTYSKDKGQVEYGTIFSLVP
jgi:uncharacterized repeat protein (TIGR03803 family)